MRWADKYFFDRTSPIGSTYGEWLDFAAPANLMVGVEVGPSEYYDFDECDCSTATWTSGTSFAAPAVAGIGGLLRSIEPRLLGEDLVEMLARTTRDLKPPNTIADHDDSSGFGLPQARSALDYLDHANKAFVQGRIGAYGSHGSLAVIDTRRELRSFLNFPQFTSRTESTTVYRLRGSAQFAAGFSVPPDVWTRSSGTLGFLDSTVIDYQSAVYRGRIVPGTVASDTCLLETFVFHVDGLGWVPALPESARIAFSCLAPSSLVGVDYAPGSGPGARAYPNPARGSVRFEITEHAGGHARIQVFDVRGRRVRVLHDGPLEPGNHVRVWDGRDGRGLSLAPGVYFLRYERAGRFADRKVLLIGKANAGP